ncbi:MAG: HU family DNA-binding protein [Erysipelotrichaceae bacterium]|nr:HU family DNA-binding protein [Erysipelotrichaceae bacterium]
MADLNKKALVELVAESQGLTKKASTEIVDSIIEAMTNTLKDGGEVDLPGFGKFTVKERAARTGINPATGEKIKIEATKVPGFKAAKALKEAVK